MSSFQTDEERAAQKAREDVVINTIIPDTQNLEEKYPILHPTAIDGELSRKIKNAILTDFDKWNEGYDVWSQWADTYYDSNLNYCAYTTMKTLDEIKAERKQEAENTEVKRVYFDNMLILKYNNILY